MTYSENLSVSAFSSKPVSISKDEIRFDKEIISTSEITGFRYQQVEQKVNGFRVSTQFNVFLVKADGKEFPIQFVGTAGSTANMEKQYSRIIDLVWKYAGNRVLNEVYKTLLEGKFAKIGNATLTPRGVSIEKFKLFGKNSQHLIKWEDLDYHITVGGFLHIKSLGEESVSTDMNVGVTTNGIVLYSLLKWLYEDADRIAAIYQANGIEF